MGIDSSEERQTIVPISKFKYTDGNTNHEERQGRGAGRVCWGLAEKATFEQSLEADEGWGSPCDDLKEKLSTWKAQEVQRPWAWEVPGERPGQPGS